MDDQQWRIDILDSTPGDGTPIPIRGNGSAGVVAWVPDNTDDPFSCFKTSTLTMNLIQEGQINISELQTAQDRDFIVKQYQNGILKWQGFLVPDGISYPLLSNPNNITLSAICGLTMLADIPYTHTDLQGVTSALDYCPMNYIRDILFLNLGSYLPIRWTNLLQCTAFDNQDVFTGGVQWSVKGEGYLSYQSGQDGDNPGPQQTCDYILKGILQSMQCTIYLADGRWNIRRINDVVRTVVPYKQIDATTGIMVIHSGSQNITKLIGRNGFGFLNENAVVTVKQGVKTCKTTYSANIRDNILPNGNQDLLLTPPTSPLYWGFYTVEFNTAISVDSLHKRNGKATQISHLYTGENEQNGYYTLISEGGTLEQDGLPVDLKTLIAYINFGFTFCPVYGFPNTDDIIDWSSEPFKIRVVCNIGSNKYYLNKFGFWQLEFTDIPIVVDNLRINDVAQVDFNAFQNVIMPEPPTQPIAGDTCDVQIIFVLQGTQEYIIDDIYINIAKGNDVFESTYKNTKNTSVDERQLNISSSFGGYMISNFMTDWSKSDSECFFRDEEAYTGTLTGLNSNSIMRCLYKAMRILNSDINVFNKSWSFDSTFLADSMGTSLFLPLNASYDTEKCQINGLVAIEIRNDFVDLSEKYYSSNDDQLSN